MIPGKPQHRTSALVCTIVAALGACGGPAESSSGRAASSAKVVAPPASASSSAAPASSASAAPAPPASPFAKLVALPAVVDPIHDPQGKGCAVFAATTPAELPDGAFAWEACGAASGLAGCRRLAWPAGATGVSFDAEARLGPVIVGRVGRVGVLFVGLDGRVRAALQVRRGTAERCEVDNLVVGGGRFGVGVRGELAAPTPEDYPPAFVWTVTGDDGEPARPREDHGELFDAIGPVLASTHSGVHIWPADKLEPDRMKDTKYVVFAGALAFGVHTDDKALDVLADGAGAAKKLVDAPPGARLLRVGADASTLAWTLAVGDACELVAAATVDAPDRLAAKPLGRVSCTGGTERIPVSGGYVMIDEELIHVADGKRWKPGVELLGVAGADLLAHVGANVVRLPLASLGTPEAPVAAPAPTKQDP
ncbi:MAG TPA: hypothetical protein VGM56_06040 [Byssovorax sp.]|jgi:hypothetical protein